MRRKLRVSSNDPKRNNCLKKDTNILGKLAFHKNMATKLNVNVLCLCAMHRIAIIMSIQTWANNHGFAKLAMNCLF